MAGAVRPPLCGAGFRVHSRHVAGAGGESESRELTPNGDSLYFELDSQSYPLRVRLVFTAAVLSDLYVYRSDF